MVKKKDTFGLGKTGGKQIGGLVMGMAGLALAAETLKLIK